MPGNPLFATQLVFTAKIANHFSLKKILLAFSYLQSVLKVLASLRNNLYLLYRQRTYNMYYIFFTPFCQCFARISILFLPVLDKMYIIY